MTAHAMKNDREQCLEAGMDGYVSKPIRAHDLLQTLETIELARGDAESAPAIDWPAAIEAVGGNVANLLSLTDVFRRECPMLMEQIERAISEKDAKTLRRAAHTLKGSAALFAAGDTAARAKELESMGRDARFDGAPEAFDQLSSAVKRLIAALDHRLEKQQEQAELK